MMRYIIKCQDEDFRQFEAPSLEKALEIFEGSMNFANKCIPFIKSLGLKGSSKTFTLIENDVVIKSITLN